jgi:hypothetical protein
VRWGVGALGLGGRVGGGGREGYQLRAPESSPPSRRHPPVEHQHVLLQPQPHLAAPHGRQPPLDLLDARAQNDGKDEPAGGLGFGGGVIGGVRVESNAGSGLAASVVLLLLLVDCSGHQLNHSHAVDEHHVEHKRPGRVGGAADGEPRCAQQHAVD